MYRNHLSTCGKDGEQSLHARANLGFDLKDWASLLAFAFLVEPELKKRTASMDFRLLIKLA